MRSDTPNHPFLYLSADFRTDELPMMHRLNPDGVDAEPIASPNIGEELVAHDSSLLWLHPQRFHRSPEHSASGFHRTAHIGDVQLFAEPLESPDIARVGHKTELDPCRVHLLNPLDDLVGHAPTAPRGNRVVQVQQECANTEVLEIFGRDFNHALDMFVWAPVF